MWYPLVPLSGFGNDEIGRIQIKWTFEVWPFREFRAVPPLAAAWGKPSGGPEMSLAPTDPEAEIREKSVEFFVSFVQVFGFPKSIGQIYGLLFIAEEPLSMDDIADSLQISKGSASQGLGLLRSLGAVTAVPASNDRREYFVADLNVSRIVTHFFEDRFRPCLDRGEQLLDSMVELAGDSGLKPDSSRLQRVRALQKWQTRGRVILPLVLRWLKR